MEQRYCSYCGSKLDPDARFCWNCGRPVHRDDSKPAPEVDAPTSQEVPTSQMPTSPPPSPPSPPLPPQEQLREALARGGTTLHREVVARGGIGWPMLALAAVFLVLIAGETMQGGISDAVHAVPMVAAVVLVGSVVSYPSLLRRGGGVTLGEAIFNGSVVVLAAFATFLYLIS